MAVSKGWHEHEPLAESIHGEGVVDDMRIKAAIPAKGIKKRIPEVAKYYRAEGARVHALRMAGHQGIIELIDWETV